MGAVMAQQPDRAMSLATNPILRMLVSRSSFEKPSPFDRCILTSSPSSVSTCAPRRVISAASIAARVDLPEPDKPVNQTRKPLCDMFLGSFQNTVGCCARRNDLHGGLHEFLRFGVPGEELVVVDDAFSDAGDQVKEAVVRWPVAAHGGGGRVGLAEIGSDVEGRGVEDPHRPL